MLASHLVLFCCGRWSPGMWCQGEVGRGWSLSCSLVFVARGFQLTRCGALSVHGLMWETLTSPARPTMKRCDTGRAGPAGWEVGSGQDAPRLAGPQQIGGTWGASPVWSVLPWSCPGGGARVCEWSQHQTLSRYLHSCALGYRELVSPGAVTCASRVFTWFSGRSFKRVRSWAAWSIVATWAGGCRHVCPPGARTCSALIPRARKQLSEGAAHVGPSARGRVRRIPGASCYQWCALPVEFPVKWSVAVSAVRLRDSLSFTRRFVPGSCRRRSPLATELFFPEHLFWKRAVARLDVSRWAAPGAWRTLSLACNHAHRCWLSPAPTCHSPVAGC